MSVNFALLCRNFSFTMHNLIFSCYAVRSKSSESSYMSEISMWSQRPGRVASERNCLCHPELFMVMRKLPGIPIETLMSFLFEPSQATNSGWQVTFGGFVQG
jgi:hypothetical protein